MMSYRINLLKSIVSLIILTSLAYQSYADDSNVRKYTLTFKREIRNPDGKQAKSVVVVQKLADGEDPRNVDFIYPGPTLYFTEGDSAEITVVNKLSEFELLSIHWHGIEQKGTPWSDGTAGITNCPINYNSEFTYKFEANAAGTFWYHSHHASLPYSEGGYGMLVVEDLNTKDYIADIPLIISDLYYQEGGVIETGLHALGPYQVAPNPVLGYRWPMDGNGILINGTSGDKNKGFLIKVQANKKYRIRLLNAASNAFYNFAIAGHDLTVINIGGEATEPVKLKSIDIGIGQRFDFILDTSNHDVTKKYQIGVITNWRSFPMDELSSNYFNNAYVVYNDNPSFVHTEWVKPLNEYKEWHDQILKIKPLNRSFVETTKYNRKILLSNYQVPVESDGVLAYDRIAEQVIVGDASNKKVEKRVFDYDIPSTPLLLASLLGKMNNNYYSEAALPIKINEGDVVRMVIQNRVADYGRCDMHPWHLHGYDFHVIGYGTGEYNEKVHKPGNVYVGDRSVGQLSNPLKVDTVLSFNTDFGCSRLTTPNCSGPTTNVKLPAWGEIAPPEPCGWTEIQFEARNLGTWIFHCHIEWHISMGMSIVFDVNSEKLWQNNDSKLNNLEKIGLCGFVTLDTVSPIKPLFSISPSYFPSTIAPSYSPSTRSPSSSPSTPKSCKTGFVEYRSRCYYKSNESKNMSACQKECISKQSSMLCIGNEETNKYLFSTMNSIDKVWIGYNCIKPDACNVKNNWQWIKGCVSNYVNPLFNPKLNTVNAYANKYNGQKSWETLDNRNQARCGCQYSLYPISKPSLLQESIDAVNTSLIIANTKSSTSSNAPTLLINSDHNTEKDYVASIIILFAQMIVMISAGLFISLFIIACVYKYVRSLSSVSISNKVLNYNEYTPIYDRA